MPYLNNNRRAPGAKPQKAATPKGLFIAALLIVAALVAGGGLLLRDHPEKSDSSAPAAKTPAFDKTQFSLSDPTSPWVVVNKQRPLSPRSFTPGSLTAPGMRAESQAMQVNAQVATALTALDQAARAANINLMVVSAYRSYDTQKTVYDSEVRGFGQAQADRESARPGHSEHQTGWAADLGAVSSKCEIKLCFADTPEGQWLAANAYTYGFVIRYAKDKEAVTGYQYEPWHLRYVGKELAAEMHKQRTTTLEEFFNLPPAPGY